MHPFRFGTMLGSPDRGQWLAQIHRAESNGYTTISVSDHFGGRLAPLLALANAAEHTGLRLGTLVLANDFRHPAVVAKEVASLDQLSVGRVELGIGAGWLAEDYEGSGIPKDEPSIRVDRLGEAVAVIKGLWGPGRFSHEGSHYRIDMDGQPKPVQQPHPPILIGGGSKRVLRLAGREADIVGLSVRLDHGTRSQLDEGVVSTTRRILEQKLEWLREGAGDRFDRLELNTLVFEAHVTDSPGEVLERIGSRVGAPPEVVAESPQVLVGSVEEICETLESRRAAYGISYYTFYEPDIEEMAPVVERLSGT